MLRNRHALAALHDERLGHDGYGQDAELFRDLGNHRRRAGAGAAAHAGRYEQHVGALDHFLYAVAVFHRGLPADVRIRTRTKPLCNIAADLQRRAYARAIERLRVGIGTDEIDALYSCIHHMGDSVTATAANADHLDDGALAMRIH